jgi:hypothetical protein
LVLEAASSLLFLLLGLWFEALWNFGFFIIDTLETRVPSFHVMPKL